MLQFELKPNIAESAFIAPGAQVIGDVRLCGTSSVWHNAVLRGDMASIKVGGGSNVQDNCTLHCDAGVPLVIGNNVTVGHNAALHSCTVGDGSLIGIGAAVLSGAAIGKGCVIAAGSVVTSGAVVPDGSLYMGIPAKFKRELSQKEREKLLDNAAAYVSLAKAYKERAKGKVTGECVTSMGLDAPKLNAIKELAEICEKKEPLHLKLNWSTLEHRNDGEMNDIFCYDGKTLAGYLGLYEICKDLGEIELTGMVRPEYRRMGIFNGMFAMALEECRRRKAEKALLVTNVNSASGAEFAKSAGMSFEHTEYGMKCEKCDWNMRDSMKLTFRKAVNRDLKELAYIDMMGFELTRKQAEGFYERPFFNDYYIAEADGRPVGKVCVSHELGEGYVFGLVVAPNFRGRGFGREILDYALDMIFSDGFSRATLEVDSTNKIAQSLYRSCGFSTVEQYDYYEIALR